MPPLTLVSDVFHSRGKVCPSGTGMRPAWCGASRDAARRLWWPTWCLPSWAVTPLPRHILGHPTGLLVPPSRCESWDCLSTSLSPTWLLLHTRVREKQPAGWLCALRGGCILETAFETWSPGNSGVVVSHHVPPHFEQASVSVVSVPLTLAQSIFPNAR